MAADNRADDRQGWAGSLPELLLLAGLALAFCWNVHLFEVDPGAEWFHIESARETALANRFWIPTLQGHDYLARAPLWTWLLTILFKLFGSGLVVARIPAIVFAFASIAMTYLVGTALFQNRVAALFSALVLATGWGFFHRAVLSSADIPAGCLVLAFTWLVAQWHPEVTRRYVNNNQMKLYSLLFGAVLGLLLLLKGMLTVTVLLLALLIFVVLNGGLGILRTLYWTRLLGVMFGLPLLWLVPVAIVQDNSGVILDTLFALPFQQFTGQGWWANLQGDPFRYLRLIAFDLMPYGLFLIAFALDEPVQRRMKAPERNWVQWLLILFGTALVFWSVSRFQEATALLPYYPAVALVVGYYLGRVMEMGETSRAYNTLIGIYIVSLMLLAVGLTVFVFQFLPDNYVTGFWQLPGIPLIESLGREITLEYPIPLWKMWLVPAPFILIAGGTVLYFMFENRRLHLAGFALIATSLAFLVFFKAVYMPVLTRPVAQTLAAHVNRGPQKAERIVVYSRHADLKRALIFLDDDLANKLEFVDSPQALKNALAQRPEKGALYGLSRGRDFYDLDGDLRATLRVEDANWKLDVSRFPELARILRARLPMFDRMESHLVLFQSVLPPDTRIDPLQSLMQEKPKTKKRGRRRR